METRVSSDVVVLYPKGKSNIISTMGRTWSTTAPVYISSLQKEHQQAQSIPINYSSSPYHDLPRVSFAFNVTSRVDIGCVVLDCGPWDM